MQLKRDAAGSANTVEKKNKDELDKPDKAKYALARFQRPDKMRSSDWKATIGCVVPWHSSSEAVAKCKTIP